jgi:parallel beta-helix repeat protein
VSFSGRGKLEDNDIFSNAKEGMLIESSGNPFVRANRVYVV